MVLYCFKKVWPLIRVEPSPAHIKEHVYDYEGNKYVNITIAKNRDGANEYGKTHHVKINDYKPEPKKEKVEEDLPF